MRGKIIPFALGCSLSIALIAQGQTGLTFKPQFTFAGSKLDGWQSIGAAQWQAREGEIVGKAQAEKAGVLMSGRRLQDVAIHFAFQSPTEVEVGVLLRFEQTSDG